MLLAELGAIDFLVHLVAGVGQPGADVVAEVRCLVGQALVAVRPARLLLRLVLSVSIRSLRVVHVVETSFPRWERVGLDATTGRVAAASSAASARYQRRCTGRRR